MTSIDRQELLNSDALVRLLDEALIMGNYINGDAGRSEETPRVIGLRGLKKDARVEVCRFRIRTPPVIHPYTMLNGRYLSLHVLIAASFDDRFTVNHDNYTSFTYI